MNSTAFREGLIKIMPGYKWTVHRSYGTGWYLSATGIMSAGFNRLSTLSVIRRDRDGKVSYQASSAGFSSNAPFLGENSDGTLARALRGLQEHYEQQAANYGRHAARLKSGREG